MQGWEVRMMLLPGAGPTKATFGWLLCCCGAGQVKLGQFGAKSLFFATTKLARLLLFGGVKWVFPVFIPPEVDEP